MAYVLSILGPPLLQGPDGPIRAPATKAQALLWHLAAQPDTAFSRSHLTTLLWPDDSESEGRNRLNTTLSRLRQAMPVYPIRQNGDMLQWDRFAGVSLDTLRFMEISRATGLEGAGSGSPHASHLPALTEAVGLWRGPLLQGFVPAFSSTYEEWLEQERGLWERRILEALARLVQLEEDHAIWDRVVAHCQQALGIDPLQERFHRSLMGAYCQTGERAAALSQYTHCAGIMEAQLGVSPDPATTRLGDQIARGELERLPDRSPRQPVAPVAAAMAPAAGGDSERDLAILAAWSGRPLQQVRGDQALAAMGRLALTDPLTGLYNRRCLESLVEMEIRAGRAPVLVLLEMRGLRRINDTLGLERGDAVIRSCGTYFKQEFPRAVAVRLGGGGFALLFPDLALSDAAEQVQQALSRLREALVIPDLRGAIEFAAGLAGYPDDGTELASLLKAAEEAVYWAKKQPVNRVRLARERHATETEVHGLTVGQSAALAGRESLWERMRQHLDRAAAGQGSMLVLEGPVGSGKSRLLAELARTARTAGFRVAEVSPDPAAGLYMPVTAAFKALTGQEPEGPGAEGPYTHVLSLVERLKQQVEDGPPVLICMDDLQEAGNLTALALVRMGLRLHRRRLMLAVALRSGGNELFDWTSLIAVGLANQSTVREVVAGLDLNGTRRLAVTHLGSLVAGPAVRLLHETTGGNPLFLIQVLRAWVESGVLAPGPTGWQLEHEAAARAPRDLFAALLWRMTHLDPEVQEVLGMAAVLGRQFHLRDLKPLTGRSETELAAELDGAVAESMLVVAGDDLYRFAHPILQEVAYESLTPGVRRLAHGMAGLMLVETGLGTAAELARHFDAAGQLERSYIYHLKAGAEATAMHAYLAARQHLGRAWQIMPVADHPDSAERRRLPLALCRVSIAGGDLRTAVTACREALQSSGAGESSTRATLLLEMGKMALAAGDGDGAARSLRELEPFFPQLAPGELAQVEALRVRSRILAEPDEQALEQALRLAEEARALAAPELEGVLLTDAARAMITLGHPRATVGEIARRAVALLPAGGSLAAPIARLTAAFAANSLADALVWVEEALEAAVLSGAVFLWPVLLHAIGRLERTSGSWHVARRTFEAGLLIATRIGSHAERCQVMAEMGLLMAWSGEREEALALASATTDTARMNDHALSALDRARIARCLTAAGQPEEALRLLAGAEDRSHGAERPLEYRLALVDALTQVGDLQRAAAESAGLPKPNGELVVHHALILGRLARRLGRPQEAVRWLNQAIAQAGRPFAEQYEIAQAYLEQAELLKSRGETQTADQQVQAARAILGRIGLGTSDLKLPSPRG